MKRSADVNFIGVLLASMAKKVLARSSGTKTPGAAW
jgi:hypothetical protein